MSQTNKNCLTCKLENEIKQKDNRIFFCKKMGMFRDMELECEAWLPKEDEAK